MDVTDVDVDVALPAYRRATFLAEAIESVFAQTHERWHLTISDNGPGGGDVERAIEPYLSDSRVTHLVTGRELPLAENWTNALNAGASPYVSLLNDDDRFHPDFLSVRLRALETHRECGFAFGEWNQIDEEGVITDIVPPKHAEGLLDPETVARWFWRKNPVAPSTTMARRSALEAVGSHLDGRWQYCDWELWARLGARFPVFYVARQDSDFRRHARAYTFATAEEPRALAEMTDHIGNLFAGSGGSTTRVDRARIRSLVLLDAAGDVHMGAGWRASWLLYRRAVREYPPSLFRRRSLQMISHSLLGKQGSRTVARAVRRISAPLRGPTTR